MQIKQAYQMEEIAETVKNSNHSKTLAANLKKLRLEHYKQYQKLNSKIDNPYSLDNISSLLGISRRHYSRLENPNYTTKNITLEKLIILSKIYEVSIDDLVRKNFE